MLCKAKINEGLEPALLWSWGSLRHRGPRYPGGLFPLQVVVLVTVGYFSVCFFFVKEK